MNDFNQISTFHGPVHQFTSCGVHFETAVWAPFSVWLRNDSLPSWDNPPTVNCKMQPSRVESIVEHVAITWQPSPATVQSFEIKSCVERLPSTCLHCMNSKVLCKTRVGWAYNLNPSWLTMLMDRWRYCSKIYKYSWGRRKKELINKHVRRRGVWRTCYADPSDPDSSGEECWWLSCSRQLAYLRCRPLIDYCATMLTWVWGCRPTRCTSDWPTSPRCRDRVSSAGCVCHSRSVSECSRAERWPKAEPLCSSSDSGWSPLDSDKFPRRSAQAGRWWMWPD